MNGQAHALKPERLAIAGQVIEDCITGAVNQYAVIGLTVPEH